MAVNLNQPPYYDDFDPNKQYTQLLAVPGRVEQAREFTQVQSLFAYYLKKLSDTLFRDGSIISGMDFTLNEETGELTVYDGEVYLNGKILSFKQQSVILSRVGLEQVGVKLVEEIVTENEDPSLRDPAQGMENYGQPGAHRLKSSLVLTLNDPDASVIYEFENGQLVVEPAKPQFGELMNVLAKRTYDESGNYRVEGYELFVQPYDANYVELTVEPGLAYVLGHEVHKPVPTKILIPMAKDTRRVENEPKMYIDGTDIYPLNKYPVKQITEVVATVEKTVQITRGSIPDGIDPLPDSSVVQIVSVTDGTTEYVQGQDYILTADSVDWSPDGEEPAGGTTYYVTYHYRKILEEGTDYDLYETQDGWGNKKDNIRFLAGGTKPVPNTQFDVDYDFYLARVDVVSLDKDGKIIVTPGQSEIERLVKPPAINDPTLLKLGTVYLPPNSIDAVATSSAVTRLRMEDLQRMLDRLEEVEYNQAVTELDREAMAGEPPSELRGVFSDGFQSVSKADLSHPDFNIMFSLEDGTIMLPMITSLEDQPPIDESNSDFNVWGHLVSAPMTEVVAIEQQYATRAMLINPYHSVNMDGILQLTPSSYNWVDEEKTVIENVKTKTIIFYRWWLRSSDWRSRVEELFEDNVKLANGKSVSSWVPGTAATFIKTEKSTKVVESAITYMKQIDVKFKATNLQPNTDNLELYFDGIKCPITPINGHQAGTIPGTIRSNASGVAEGQFKIPANVRTGTRKVELKNRTNYAETSFTSIGTKRKVTEIINKTKIIVRPADPLAQTFQFDHDTVLTSVGVYFSAKEDGFNVVCQIRNVVNGYPGQEVYAEKALTPSEIKVSPDGTLETKITFDDPVFCRAHTQYCMVFITDSDKAAMFVAELGETDLATKQRVLKNPYLAGMLFSSSNGITWTAHQSMNLKFKVYKAQFAETGTIQFEPITGLSADRLLLLADFLTPQNTGCIWEMSVNDGPFQPINSYEEVDLGEIINKVVLRATFKADKNMSPLLGIDGFNFLAFTQSSTGSYISRNTDGYEDNIGYVKVEFDGYIPSGCSITPRVSFDDGESWHNLNLVNTKQVNAEFTRFTYELDGITPATHSTTGDTKQFRVRLDFVSSSQVARPKARRLLTIQKQSIYG